MEFKKIGITDTYTLNATYTNYDGDTITLSGCNAVHPDLLNAFHELVAAPGIIDRTARGVREDVIRLGGRGRKQGKR